MDINKKARLTAPPLSPEERERRARQIEEGANKPGKPIPAFPEPIGKLKPVTIRIPESFIKDLKEIKKYTGLPVNSICLELLRVAIKQKLKEVKTPAENE